MDGIEVIDGSLRGKERRQLRQTSTTGTRTRVARVRAGYPNWLGCSGSCPYSALARGDKMLCFGAAGPLLRKKAKCSARWVGHWADPGSGTQDPGPKIQRESQCRRIWSQEPWILDLGIQDSWIAPRQLKQGVASAVLGIQARRS